MSRQVHPLEWAKRVTHASNGQPLDAKEKLVLLLLTDLAGRTGEAWPLISTLASYSCLSVRSVRYALTGLKEKGLISITYTKTEERLNKPNRYRVLVDLSLLDSVEAEFVQETADPGVEAPVEKLTIRAVAAELTGEGGIIDTLLRELDPTSAFITALDYADELAAAYPELSKDPAGFLRNAVVARCAWDLHSIDAKSAARLSKEAKVLGPTGHARIIQALAHTASAPITGDAVSYVCAAARRLNATEVLS